MYRILFALRTKRRRITITLLAFFGATVTVTQLVLWISGVKAGSALAASLITIALIGLAFALRASLPKADITFRHDSVTAPVRVRIGDIFAPAGSVIMITMNRHFDTAPPWVSADCLITRLIQMEYASRPGDLRGAILKEVALDQEAEQPVGEIVRIAPGQQPYLLLAVADPMPFRTACWGCSAAVWQPRVPAWSR